MLEDSLFSHYKPLRNQLKSISLWESLGVVRSYIQHLQINQPLPRDISVLNEYLQRDSIQKRRWMAEWNLAVLAKEIILNAQEIEPSQPSPSLKKWDFLASAVNKLKDLEGEISSLYINQNNRLSEIRRIFF